MGYSSSRNGHPGRPYSVSLEARTPFTHKKDYTIKTEARVGL
jgi:hypothetical protein